MARRFKKVNYEDSGKQTVTIDDCLPGDHLARFIVAIISILDLSAIYARYALVGGEAFAPEILLGLLLYGYATGVFSSRKMRRRRTKPSRFASLRVGCILTTTRLPTFGRRSCLTS